jgi:DNA-directed RNA polymerase specialized sigma24 family protein
MVRHLSHALALSRRPLSPLLLSACRLCFVSKMIRVAGLVCGCDLISVLEALLNHPIQRHSTQRHSIQLFARARDGDPSATATVTEILRPRLVSMAWHYARRSREDPDDLLQEAWLGLLEALRDLDTGIGSPEHYLVQRARWRLLDAVRRARLRCCDSLDSDALAGSASEYGAPGPGSFRELSHGSPHGARAAVSCGDAGHFACCHQAQHVGGLSDCADFADGLKATQRAVLRCLLDGLTWREAGHALGCSSANIAYHVRQIRRRYTDWNADVNTDGCSVEAAPILSKRPSCKGAKP